MAAVATATADSVLSIGDGIEFLEFDSASTLLDSIDFDDLFDGFPDLDDIDSSDDQLLLFTEYLSRGCSSEEEEISEIKVSSSLETESAESSSAAAVDFKLAEFVALIDEAMTTTSLSSDEINDRGDGEIEIESEKTAVGVSSASANRSRRKWRSSKSSRVDSKNQRKRKVKVDWTPELHRRFVEAVEQLGMDKAVPSRILEMMGIDCLTRHNVASHLQKYRSRRKHLVIRETDAATWCQEGQVHGVAMMTGGKGTVHWPWNGPIFGFPPPGVRPMHPGFRPLHAWGHPSMEMWPRPLAASQSPMPPRRAWAPPPHHPPFHPSFWHPHCQHVPYALAPPASCFTQAVPTMRFPTPPIPGIPPHSMHIPDHGTVQSLVTPSGVGHPPLDSDLTKESIDTAIGDVLAKPWLPLPIGLKPPSVDSVLVELQRLGVPKIPPATTACA